MRWIAWVGMVVLSSGCANSCEKDEAKKVSQGFQVALPADARALFENAEVLEIFATAPDSLGLLPDAAAPESEVFHGYKIVGRATVTDPGDRKAIVDALLGGIARHKSAMVACNEPRHGFRATRGAEHADIHMSFGCLHGTLYTKTSRATLLTAKDSKDDIDEMFAKYKVPSGK